jgi:hypothetical protein
MVIICYHQHLMVIAIQKNQTKYPGQPCWDGSPKKKPGSVWSMFDHSFVWEYGISKILKKVVVDHQSPHESGKFRSTPE